MSRYIYIINRIGFAIALCFLLSLAVMPASAVDAAQLSPEISGVGDTVVSKLADGSYYTFASLGKNASLELSCTEEIGSLYIVFHKPYGEFLITDTDTKKSVACGKDSFLHTYLDIASLLGEDVKNIRLDFGEDELSVADIYAFGAGKTPDWVQKWKAPCDGEADLLLISSHSDDEHLFFAGTLPYYAVERGLAVQVVYFTHHFDTTSRPHEQLNGLWTVGVTYYPVISEFPDLYSLSLDSAISQYARAGYSEDAFVAFQVEMLRRFKPLVVLGHDINGEYGHGTHKLNSKTLMQAVHLSADEKNYPESAERWGVWDVPKTYIHLWEENKIVMDWDTPYDSLGKKTPYQLSVKGYECHKSQHIFPDLMEWLAGTSTSPITRASEIKGNSPCEFGLYRTTVGEDVYKNDFFENIVVKKTASETADMPSCENMRIITYTEHPTDDVNDSLLPEGMLFYGCILLISATFITLLLCIMLFRRRIWG